MQQAERFVEPGGVFVSEERPWKLCNRVGCRGENSKFFPSAGRTMSLSPSSRFTDYDDPIDYETGWATFVRCVALVIAIIVIAFSLHYCAFVARKSCRVQRERRDAGDACLPTRTRSYGLNNWEPRENHPQCISEKSREHARAKL